MNREQKAESIKEIGTQLDGSTAVFAVDYRGISVTQAAELRVQLGEADTTFSVVKNRLAKRATEGAGASDLDEHLVGPTALTYVRGDAVLAAKAINDFFRKNGVPTYKGGIMEGKALDPEQFTTIARLPGVDVLRGQLVGLAASPLTGIVRTLNQLIQGLASQLGQVAEQGLVSGEPPADAKAAPEPAAEEPAPEPDAGEPDAEAGAAEPAPNADDAEIAEAPGTEEAGEEAAAEADGDTDPETDADTDDDDSTSETEADETPSEGDDAGAGDDKED